MLFAKSKIICKERQQLISELKWSKSVPLVHSRPQVPKLKASSQRNETKNPGRPQIVSSYTCYLPKIETSKHLTHFFA